MGATAALLGLYACAVVPVALAARFLRRPIPGWALAVAALLPVLLMPESFFFTDRTPLPLDHARSIPPWSVAGAPAPANPDVNDVALQFLPWAKATRVALKGGELPWRNRWSGCGAPLAANAISGAFSPFTLLGLLLPLARAFTLAAAVKILLAAAGTWLFARELSISPGASLFAAVATGLSFAMTAWLLFPQASVFSLLPWMLFLIELAREREAALRASLALTLCFAALFLSGHPETLVLGLAFAALWILGRRLAGSLPGGLPLLARAAAAGALAAALTAWLLLPELAAIRASNRFESMASSPVKAYISLAPHGPIAIAGLVTSVFPHAFGSSVGSPPIAGAPAAFPELAYGYAGILPVLLALLVFRPGARRRREEIVLLVLVGVALALSIGLWPFLELVSVLPGISSVSPLRFLAWLPLAVPLLGAFELDRLAADVRDRAGARFAFPLASVALALAAVFAASRLGPLHRAAGGLGFQRRELFAALLLLSFASAAAVLFARRPPVLAALLAAATAAELLRGGARLYRPFPADWMYPETPLLKFVRSRPGVFRVAGQGATLYPETPVFAGLEDVRTHDPVERRDYVEFLDATCGFAPLDYFKTLKRVDCAALDFLNVRYLLSSPEDADPGPKWKPVYADAQGRVFENPAALPRVFAPASIEFVPPAAQAPGNANRRFGGAFHDFTALQDFRRAAYVLDDVRHGRISNPSVEITDYAEKTNSASFRARSASGPAFVAASLTQDGGWTARDETGRELLVHAANGPFLAVEVPSGEHTIRLRYRPPGFAAGLAISVASLVALCVAAALSLARDRRG